MGKFQVLIADNISPKCQELFGDDFHVVSENLRGQELLDRIGEFDGLIVRSGCKVTKEVFAKAKKLKVVVRAGVGVDNIDIEAATENSTQVMNTPNGNTNAAAEHTIGLIFALSRNIVVADRAAKSGRWRSKELQGVELSGKTLGVIGLGRVGRSVSQKAKGIGMKVLGYDPLIPESVDLETIFKESDYITVHVPLLPSTKGLINIKNIVKMKKNVRIINCARGGVIDEEDLILAIQQRWIAGAALDVFEVEPLIKNHPLNQFNNVILTPHLGASTAEAQIAVGVMAGEQVIGFLKEDKVVSGINKLEITKINLSETLGE